MKFLSFSEYQNEKPIFNLPYALYDMGIPKKQFVLTALEIAKSVLHLVPENCKVPANLCIETVEKFLRGEATVEECRKADAAASAAYAAGYASTSAAGYAAAEAAGAASSNADAAYAAGYSAAAFAAAAYAVSSAIVRDPIDIFREYLPWELVCSYQIAKVLNREEDQEFVLQIPQNKKLVSYATMILSEPSMHPSFEFFMTEFFKNHP